MGSHVIVTLYFNYRGMMYNGERVISLWKGKKEDKKETDIEDYQMPNPCGPASNNSDPKAVQLHIKFDSYGFPMYFPSCTSPSWSVVLGQQKNTNVAVRRQFNRLLDYIRQGKLHSVSVTHIILEKYSLEEYAKQSLKSAWPSVQQEIPLYCNRDALITLCI